MADDCCYLVGNFDVNIAGCIISINTSSKAQFSQLCSDNSVVMGPVVGTLSMTAYADDKIYKGCPAGAGVSIPWVVKYDCDNDILYYIFAGEGDSYVVGDASGYASRHITSPASYLNVSANAGSGPATLYSKSCRREGYGLTYNGGPISFSTSSEGEVTYNASSIVGGLGAVDNTLYLQSFSLELTPGSVPIASYSYVFRVGNYTC